MVEIKWIHLSGSNRGSKIDIRQFLTSFESFSILLLIKILSGRIAQPLNLRDLILLKFVYSNVSDHSKSTVRFEGKKGEGGKGRGTFSTKFQSHLTSSSHGCWRHCPAVALSKGLYSNIGSKKSVNRWASSTLQLYLSIRTENMFQVFSLVMCRRLPENQITPVNRLLWSVIGPLN